MKKITIKHDTFWTTLAIIFMVFGSSNYIMIRATESEWTYFFLDSDRLENGLTRICATDLQQAATALSNKEPPWNENPHCSIIEVDRAGEIVWQHIGLHFPHEVLELPSGNLLIADTRNDRCIEINKTTHEILWEWNPKYINWTKINPNFTEDYGFSQKDVFWSHLNDVDFHSYDTWDAVLISLRNFDLVVEVNYTAEMHTPYQSENIVWYYGGGSIIDVAYHNTDLRLQHNPDYLSNGNIIICDSENDRVIEVNYTTKEVVWTWEDIQGWCRDADELPNGNFLISESDFVYEVNKTTNEKVWEYAHGMLTAYESDLLDNGNILISGANEGKVIEVTRDGDIVWEYVNNKTKKFVVMNTSLVLSAALIGIGLTYRYKKLHGFKKPKLVFGFVTFLFCMVTLSLVTLLWYNDIVRYIVSTIDQYQRTN